MVLNTKNIEKLLEKYDHGETSLKEEQELRTYFSQKNVAPQLESYRIMFQHFTNTKQETFTKDVPLQSKKRSYIYQWISVAAVIVIMFGIFTQLGSNESITFEDLSKEEQIAYHQTKQAFDLLSSKFSEGQSNVSVLGVVGTQFEKGIEKVEYASEFSKATDKILKKPVKTENHK